MSTSATLPGWFLCCAAAAAVAVPAAADDRPEAVYQVRMEAEFDPETGEVVGVERLRWRNTSEVPVDELQFHLYLNAFANNRSTFLEESGGEHRGNELDERWGFIEVDAMRLAYGRDITAEEGGGTPLPQPLSPGRWVDVGAMRFSHGADLKAVEEFIRPDDGNVEDRTVARYPLPEAVGPGEWVELEIPFSAKLPGIFARTGVHGEYVLGGQWFPKIGVFEKAGRRGRVTPAWNTHQFHANSEFYADFGDWDVSLTLPERYRGKVGATGRMVEGTVDDGRLTVRFIQTGVHDFAWTAAPGFVVIEDRFDPATDVPVGQVESIAEQLGLPASELELEPIDIRLMLQPEHRVMARRYLESAKAAIRGYGLRLGAYPYPTLTIVDPPRGAIGSGGMEYPTFITGGSHPWFAVWPFDRVLMTELVTVHEFGHNYFYGMIASNEFEEAWIDEGINSYYEMVVMEESYGIDIDLLGMRISPFEQAHGSLAGGRFTDSVDQRSWTYRSSGSYGLNSYNRPAVTLRHLENLLGPEVFHRAMRRFFQEWRFNHPTTADFENAMQRASGEDIGWFLEQALHTPFALDYAVRLARATKVRERAGWFWEEGDRVLVGDLEEPDDESGEQGAGEPVDTGAEEGGEGNGDDEVTTYRNEVVVERRGEFRHPVTVELVFDDGQNERRVWDGQERWVRWVETRAAKLVSVEVDPDQMLSLDVDRLNNSRRLEPDRRASGKVLVHLLFWLQNLFEAAALVG